MSDGRAVLLRADARNLPLEDGSVDLIVTSPPYFALRNYEDGGEVYGGQVGAEPTPAEFVDALIECTREMVRVLKPSGSIFVNLGDKYAGSGGNNNAGLGERATKRGPKAYNKSASLRHKSLLGLPWRYAIRCCDELDLILRAEIVWSKPNGLPESVGDRVRRAHEQWFHFTKEPKYFAAIDEIREEYISDFGKEGKKASNDAYSTRASLTTNYDRSEASEPNPLGKLPGSVWSIPTQSLHVPDHLGVDHYAAFPTEWPRRLILGWSPSGICTGCGEGRRPISARMVEKWQTGHRKTDTDSTRMGGGRSMTANRGNGPLPNTVTRTITGYECGCDEATAPTRPAVVLDPFGGTGTTAAVAKSLGRVGISVDLSADYLRLAEWRTNGKGYERVIGKVYAEDDDAAAAAAGQQMLL